MMEFPRANTRGPIEALVAPGHGTERLLFPRANTRGPIEATLAVAGHRATPHFRGLTPAAPLKPETVTVPDTPDVISAG